MRNTRWDRENKLRPLPACCPEIIPVQVYESEHNHQQQWVARYPVYNNGRPSDYVDIVVNFPRHLRPFDGDRHWVRPKGLDPHARLIFAEHVASDYVGFDAFPFRIGAEFECRFRWHNGRKHYEGSRGQWAILMDTEIRLHKDEQWIVKVVDVEPGVVKVEPVRPASHDRAVTTPERICYLEVKSLHGRPLHVEGDVSAFSSQGFSAAPGFGAPFEVVLESEDDVHVLKCEHLRRFGDNIIATVTRHGRNHGQLAEVVWVEGDPTSTRTVWDFQNEQERSYERTRRKSQAELEQERLEAEEAERIAAEEADQILRDEIWENDERPDYRDYLD